MGNKQQHKIRDEINMYREATHYGVIRMLEHFETKQQFYIVFEEISKLNLLQYINNHAPLDEQRVKQIALKLSQILEYLHDKGMILRNLEA